MPRASPGRVVALLPVLTSTVLTLTACSSSPPLGSTGPGSSPSPVASARPDASGVARSGGYYKDDGPGENPPDFDKIADARPRPERLHRFANNPYQVFGKDYVPLRTAREFRQRGIASWYGRRYHGQKTSIGESYDMYAMTAAHPTLPIPTYARITNVANGKSVVVRINDRGPFHSDRVIDLSFVAAYKLGYTQAGSTLVDVESIDAESINTERLNTERLNTSGGVIAESRPLRASPEPKPVARPAEVERPPSLPVLSDASGVYLQLGAFSMRDNAEAFRAKVYKELAWLNDVIQVVAQGGLFRLKLGPYPTPDEARQMAERIQTELNLKPVFLVR